MQWCNLLRNEHNFHTRLAGPVNVIDSFLRWQESQAVKCWMGYSTSFSTLPMAMVLPAT